MRTKVIRTALVAGVFAAVLAAGCGGATDQGLTGNGDGGGQDDAEGHHDASTGDGAGGDATLPDGGEAGDASTCVNLECQIAHCNPGAETTLRGTVYDPAALSPLYNVIVYVPNSTPAAFTDGVGCDRCGTPPSGSPIATTLTAADGTFSLKNVPNGANIPLVMQVGKWRRQITIPNVAPCQVTALTDKDKTRLPRTQAEGDIPRIAITTGACDVFECLLRNMGIADSEFTAPTGTGRVHIYQGGDGTSNGSQIPGSMATASMLWSSPTDLDKYDLHFGACECSEVVATKPQTSIDDVVAYANKGGRLLLAHYQYYWIDPQIVTPGATDAWTNTAAFHMEVGGATTITTTIDTGFPKGQALADWLVTVGASTTSGSLTVNDARYNATAVTAPSLRWIYSASPASLMQYTFNTPVGTPSNQQCGKVLFSDFHVAGTSNSMPFPQECIGNMFTPQQKAFEFMLFDLSSCIQNDTDAPKPPPIR